MKRFKLIKIRDKDVFYADEEQMPHGAPLHSFPSQEIMRYFSLEDQEIINNAAIDDGFYIGMSKTGERMLVPYRRQNHIFFFVVLFALTILTSIFTSLRYIHINEITLYGNFLFFPLAFACTDIINELYGYNRVRTVINMTALVLMVIACLLFITLHLNGTLNDGSSDTDFISLFYYVPQVTVLWAFSLLLADSLNAYLFHRIKRYLKGRALWLRSIISTFIAHFIFSPLIVSLEMLSGRLKLSADQMLDLLLSGHWVKMIYAICSLPLIYGAVYFVRNKEQEELNKGVTV